MLKKITPHTRTLPAYFAVLIVLLSFGFVSTGSINVLKNHASYVKPEGFDKSCTHTSCFASKKSSSSLPEELPITIEEEEENSDDENNNDTILTNWLLQGQTYSTHHTLSALTYSTDCPQPLAVPLYILFHSWKNFIC